MQQNTKRPEGELQATEVIPQIMKANKDNC